LDFRINRNKCFFLTIETSNDIIISWLLPKVIIYVIFSCILLLLTSLLAFAGREVLSSTLFFMINIFNYLLFIITYLVFYIKNFKLVKKYKSIKDKLKNKEKKEKEKEIQDKIDDIIKNNKKTLRKLKIKNLKDELDNTIYSN